MRLRKRAFAKLGAVVACCAATAACLPDAPVVQPAPSCRLRLRLHRAVVAKGSYIATSPLLVGRLVGHHRQGSSMPARQRRRQC